MKPNQIKLPSGDKRFLEGFRSKGQHSARETTRAHILLALEAGVPTVQIQKVLGVSRMVIWRARSAYQEKGLDYALYDAGRDLRLRVCADQEAETESKAADPQHCGS